MQWIEDQEEEEPDFDDTAAGSAGNVSAPPGEPPLVTTSQVSTTELPPVRPSVDSLRAQWEGKRLGDVLKCPMQGVAPMQNVGESSGPSSQGLWAAAGLPPSAKGAGTGEQGGIAPGPQGQPVVPVANLKLEPPPRFNGGRHPGIRTWLQTVERWLRL